MAHAVNCSDDLRCKFSSNCKLSLVENNSQSHSNKAQSIKLDCLRNMLSRPRLSTLTDHPSASHICLYLGVAGQRLDI